LTFPLACGQSAVTFTERLIEIVVRMAQQVQVSFVDDIDGSVAEGTVSFVLDKTAFEIDLSDSNATKLRESLAPYISAARRTDGGTRPSRRTSTRPAGRRNDIKAIRAWAEAQGMKISGRGRISAEVQHAYDNRNNTPPASPEAAQVAPAAEDAPQKSRGRSKVPVAEFVSA